MSLFSHFVFCFGRSIRENLRNSWCIYDKNAMLIPSRFSFHLSLIRSAIMIYVNWKSPSTIWIRTHKRCSESYGCDTRGPLIPHIIRAHLFRRLTCDKPLSFSHNKNVSTKLIWNTIFPNNSFNFVETLRCEICWLCLPACLPAYRQMLPNNTSQKKSTAKSLCATRGDWKTSTEYVFIVKI